MALELSAQTDRKVSHYFSVLLNSPGTFIFSESVKDWCLIK